MKYSVFVALHKQVVQSSSTELF